MKTFALLCVLAACTEHGRGGGDGMTPPIDPALTDPDHPPADCGCVFDEDEPLPDTCCDTVECFFDESAGQWQIVICDAFPPDLCEACTSEEICVQALDGACQMTTSCVPRTVECPDNACTPDCELAYCGDGAFQCENRVPCGIESFHAFTCYGP